MRLPGLILAELAIAATVVAGGGYGGVRAVRYARHALGSHVLAIRGPATPLAPRKDLSTLPDPRVALEASGNFMGMSDELLL